MLIKTKQRNDHSNAAVLIFPAQTPIKEDKEIFFLFSIKQIVAVLDNPQLSISVGGKDKIEGMVKWRGMDLPVISLESCLGLPLSRTSSAQRLVVIREVYRNRADELRDVYALCKLNAAMHRLKLPFESQPLDQPEWLGQAALLQGLYAMDKKILMVIHLRRILAELKLPEEEAV